MVPSFHLRDNRRQAAFTVAAAILASLAGLVSRRNWEGAAFGLLLGLGGSAALSGSALMVLGWRRALSTPFAGVAARLVAFQILGLAGWLVRQNDSQEVLLFPLFWLLALPAALVLRSRPRLGSVAFLVSGALSAWVGTRLGSGVVLGLLVGVPHLAVGLWCLQAERWPRCYRAGH